MGFDRWPLLDARAPLAERRAAFHRALRADAAFNATLLPIVGRYLASRRAVLAGYERAGPRRALSLDRAQAIAARFFYPDTILPGGRIRSLVCTTGAGLAGLPRDLQAEAYVFAAVRDNLFAEPHQLVRAYRRHTERVNGEELGAEYGARLERARGAAWAAMAAEPALRHALRAEFRRRQAYLPFAVAEADSA